MNRKATKAELLEHYNNQTEPVEFIQFDAFGNPECFDSIIVPDEDGVSLFAGETLELMSGIWDVRVLITRERIDKEKIIRMLRKIVDWIEADPDSLKEYFTPREKTRKERLLAKLRIIRLPDAHNEDSDIIIAFSERDKGGTWDTIKRARKAGKPVKVIKPKPKLGVQEQGKDEDIQPELELNHSWR